jgi:putative methionine-R-sulfoxide reductase with GAF domain
MSADQLPRALFYSNLAAGFPSLLAPTRDPVSSMANVAARLYHSFVKHYGTDAVNWCGFYIIRDVVYTEENPNIDPSISHKKRKVDAVESESKETVANAEHHDKDDADKKALVLGPFHGLPAVPIIYCGKGVCGTCWQERTSQVVQDVHSHPNHIACDNRSKVNLSWLTTFQTFTT